MTNTTSQDDMPKGVSKISKEFKENWDRSEKWEERLEEDSVVVRNWKNEHTGSTLRVIEKENTGTNSFVLNFSFISVQGFSTDHNLMESIRDKELAIRRAKEFMNASPKGTLVDREYEPKGEA